MKQRLLQFNRPRVRRVLMVVLLLPCAAFAGGKASLVMDHVPVPAAGQPMGREANAATVTWDDDDAVRMDMKGQDSYLLMRDGNVYSVSQSRGGAQVMELSVIMKMMQSMGRTGTKAGNKNPFGSVDSVSATGATETVAGIEGRVYHMTWTDGDGSRQSGDAVLTDDALVVAMTRAYIGMLAGMAGEDTTRAFQNALPGKDRGLLRIGDQFRVGSIRRAEPSASTFTLPAKPMDMKSLMGGMGRR